MTRFATAVRQGFSEFTKDFDRIEAEAAAWASHFAAAKTSVSRGFARAEARRQNNVEFLVGIRLAGLASRVQGLTDAVVSLVNKGNPQASPPVARALFEACCVPIYLQRELLPRVRKGRTNDAQRIVFKLGVGETGALAGGHIKPLSVDSLLQSARTELSAMESSRPPEERINADELIEIYYGPLTELTHPNWAALSLGTKLGMPPQFSNPAPFDEATMHIVVASSSYILWAGGRAFDAVLAVLSQTPLDLPNREPDWRPGETRAAGRAP